MIRKISFAPGEFYHIYNQGVDKRSIFGDAFDFERFVESMHLFNCIDPAGSVYENSFTKKTIEEKDRLVHVIAFCLNNNHYHLLLEPVQEKGLELFMQRMGGYTKYFNAKYKRNGPLFSGAFKAKHITENDYLLHVSAYINLNFQVHGLPFGPPMSKSSWSEYTEDTSSKNFCKKGVILEQFPNKEAYREFAEGAVTETVKKRREDEEFDKIFFSEEEA